MQWPVDARNILVTQLRQVGDVLLTTPAVKVLRDHYPHSRISYLTETGPATLLEGNPHLDAIIRRNRKSGVLQDWQLAFTLRKARYDLVLDFFCNPRSAWLSFMTGARYRVAAYHAGRSWWYTHAPRLPDVQEYTAERKLALLRAIGIHGELVPPILNIAASAKQYIDAFFKTHQIREDTPVVTIDPTSRRPARRWIPERYVQLADRLTEQCQATVIFVWGPGEKEDVDALVRQGRFHHLLACPTDLMQLSALIARSWLEIGASSAPQHIAVAVGTPSLTIMGPTNPVNWTYPSPLHRTVQGKVDCLACNRTECATHECMQMLRVEDVECAAQQLLTTARTEKARASRRTLSKGRYD